MESETLLAEGLIWDSIDEMSNVFPASVDVDWKDATRFMVNVGRSKNMALQKFTDENPYSTPDGKCEAFWLTMFAGQTKQRGSFGKTKDLKPLMRFEHWLPEVPKDWAPTEPRVTVTSIGRLEVADLSRRCGAAMIKYARSKLSSDTRLEIDMPGVEMFQNLLPKEWTQDDIELHKKYFNDLALLWQEQPYDLYHTPFKLPSTIPDPYWEVRARKDGLVDPKSKDYMTLDSFYAASPECSTQKLREHARKELLKTISATPASTLEPGMEKFVLGRRFFISKSGHFGLAPRAAQPGDVIVILFGMEIPLICRKNGDSGYRIVGESYVHGIMDGELIQMWRKGNIKPNTISIR
jgi:hypothetical protein